MARSFNFLFTHIASVRELNFPFYQIILSEAFLIQDGSGETKDPGRNFYFPYELPRSVIKHGISRAYLLVADSSTSQRRCHLLDCRI